MTFRKEGLVNIKQGKAHLLVLLTALKRKEIYEAGIRENEIGVTYGNLSDLVGLITPGVTLWWSTIPEFIDQYCVPEILKQHPELNNITTEGLVPGKFNTWLQQQIATYGDYLSFTPITVDYPPIESISFDEEV